MCCMDFQVSGSRRFAHCISVLRVATIAVSRQPAHPLIGGFFANPAACTANYHNGVSASYFLASGD